MPGGLWRRLRRPITHIQIPAGLHLVVPDTWRDRRYFAALHGSHGSLCTVLPAEECFSLSIVADRVVLSHQVGALIFTAVIF